MADVGIVGLDTSHAESFAEIIAERPNSGLTAVWDGGDVRSESYTKQYCDKYRAKAYDNPHEMVNDVDAVLVLAVNWNAHRDLAVPFLEAGVPTLVDKPIAGTLRDVEDMQDAADGTPFFGGSAIAYHPELSALISGNGDRTLYCVGYNHSFYYGVHLIDSLCRIAGEQWVCVSPADDPGQTVDIVFADGTYATVRLDDLESREQFAFLEIDNQPTAVNIGSTKAELERTYRPYLEMFFESIDGAVDASDRVFNAAKALLAVQAALEYERPITPGCQQLSEYRVESGDFLSSYPSKTYVSETELSPQKTD